MLDTVHDTTTQHRAFRRDVLAGLGQRRKTLPSRWLYDDAGSELFERITRLPEYYPTRTETAILGAAAGEMADFVGPGATVIEYGAGAAVKTRILLDALHQPRAYLPVDIAGDFLDQTVQRMRDHYPDLVVAPVVADFTGDFHLPRLAGLAAASDGPTRRVGFFPGSTIGNLDTAEAAALLKRMRGQVGATGRALIGLDLIKDRATLIRAYDDRAGVTAAFNRNLLVRINRELEGTLPLDAFRHEARWNAEEQAIEMHLVCLRSVTAWVAGVSFRFVAGESIHTETSRKYDLTTLAPRLEAAGWQLERVWTDEDSLFAVVGLAVSGPGDHEPASSG